MIIDYEVQYKILTDEMFTSLTTPDTMIVLISLVTDVEYIVRVRARNFAGFGNFTDELTVLNGKYQKHIFVKYVHHISTFQFLLYNFLSYYQDSRESLMVKMLISPVNCLEEVVTIL